MSSLEALSYKPVAKSESLLCTHVKMVKQDGARRAGCFFPDSLETQTWGKLLAVDRRVRHSWHTVDDKMD